MIVCQTMTVERRMGGGVQTGGFVFEVFRQSLEHPSVLHYSLTLPSHRSALHLQIPKGASIIMRGRPACSPRTNKHKHTRIFFFYHIISVSSKFSR